MNINKAIQYILDKLEHELSSDFFYHSLRHTLDVVEQSKRIAQSEGIADEDDLLILETAAYFHDVGFTETYQNHEEKSCEIARKILPSFDYNDSQISAVCSTIMTTKIPQTPLNHLSEILCDADLDYLGRDDFFTIGQTLYQELLHKNIIQNEEQWNKIQINFLTNHHYFTETNTRLRTPHKLKNIDAIR